MAETITLRFPSSYSNGQKSSNEYSLTYKLYYSAHYLVHRDILRHQVSQKQGTSSTKTRSEVSGGGKKPWRQKGTGRARAGSSRSPLWRGGGVTFGPKPKIKNLKLNKKERNAALQTVLFKKFRKTFIIEDLESFIIEPKTKSFSNLIKLFHHQLDINEKILVVVSKKTIPLKLSTQNLKNIELLCASNLNSLSLLKAKKILLSPSAVNDIKEIYCDQS